MTRITGDDFMLIGLHKMAAERGDGLVPEMLEVIKRDAGGFDAGPDPVQFPERRDRPHVAGPVSNENNVIAFPLARRWAMGR